MHGVEVIARGTQLASFKKKFGGSPYVWNFSNLLVHLNERLDAPRSAVGTARPQGEEGDRLSSNGGPQVGYGRMLMQWST